MHISAPNTNMLQMVVHQPSAGNHNQPVGAQSTTATASTSAAASAGTRPANPNASASQRLKYLGNQLWQRTLGAVLISGATTAAQRAALKITSNLPVLSFAGGMTSSLMKAYPLKALENIGPSLKFPSAGQGNLYSKQELIVKIADGLLDAGLYMTAAAITGVAKSAINQYTNAHGNSGKLNDAAYAQLLRNHPETLLAINATTAGADFVHYMLTAAITASTPAVKYQLKSFASQIADTSKHMKFWTNTDQALKSNTEMVVRTAVAALGTGWLPLSSKLFPNATKTADFAQSSPLKAAGGGILRLGQGVAKDKLFKVAKEWRDRPSRNANQPNLDLEAGNAANIARGRMLRDSLEESSRALSAHGSSDHGFPPGQSLKGKMPEPTFEAGESSGARTETDMPVNKLTSESREKLKGKMPEPTLDMPGSTFEVGKSSGSTMEAADIPQPSVLDAEIELAEVYSGHLDLLGSAIPVVHPVDPDALPPAIAALLQRQPGIQRNIELPLSRSSSEGSESGLLNNDKAGSELGDPDVHGSTRTNFSVDPETGEAFFRKTRT